VMMKIRGPKHELNVGDLVQVHGCIAWKFKPDVHFNRSTALENRAWSFENDDDFSVIAIVTQLPDCGDKLCIGLVRVFTDAGFDVIVENDRVEVCRETR